MARHQSNITDTVISINLKVFLVPRDCAPFSQHQESQPLARSNYLSMQQGSSFVFSANQIYQT